MSFIECINNLKSQAEAFEARLTTVELERDAALDAYATMKAQHDKLAARWETLRGMFDMADNAEPVIDVEPTIAEPQSDGLPIGHDLRAAIERVTRSELGADFKPLAKINNEERQPVDAAALLQILDANDQALLKAFGSVGGDYLTVRALHKEAQRVGFALNEASVRNRMRTLVKQFPRSLQQRKSPLGWRLKGEIAL